MYDQAQRRTWRIMMVVVLVVPVLVMFWNLRVGALLLLFGLFTAYRALRLINASLRMEQAERNSRLEQTRANQARLVYVQLVDEQGVELPPDVQQAKLAQARLLAGPRDTVVGVKRKVD